VRSLGGDTFTISKRQMEHPQETMYRNAESSRDFVPYDQVKDILSRIKLLKTANANVYSFLPSLADEDYFMHLYKPKTIMGNGFQTNMNAGNSILKKE
jgi:hypothetical protein